MIKVIVQYEDSGTVITLGIQDVLRYLDVIKTDAEVAQAIKRAVLTK